MFKESLKTQTPPYFDLPNVCLQRVRQTTVFGKANAQPCAPIVTSVDSRQKSATGASRRVARATNAFLQARVAVLTEVGAVVGEFRLVAVPGCFVKIVSLFLCRGGAYALGQKVCIANTWCHRTCRNR
jgi:hypothetical protein